MFPCQMPLLNKFSLGDILMKKLMVIPVICLIVVACAILYFKIRANQEWKSGLYIPETQLEVALGKETREIDIEIVAVGGKYKSIIDNGDYSLEIYNSEKSYEVKKTLSYYIDSSKYSQYLIRMDLKDADIEYISGLRISSGNDVLLDKPVKITLVSSTSIISDVKISTSTATASKSGFENVYYVTNLSDKPISLNGIEWQSLSSQNTVVRYVKDVGIDDEYVDLTDSESFDGSPITISPGKEAIVIVNYSVSDTDKMIFWGSPSFVVDNCRIAPNSFGFLTIPVMSVEDILSLIQGGK